MAQAQVFVIPPNVDQASLAAATKRADERDRARRDKMFLATEVLGYDFQPDVHTELFASFPDFDNSKPLFFQSEIKDRLILWSRGHYKTTAAIVEIIQLILNFPNIRILLMRGNIENTEEWLSEILAHFTGEAQFSRLAELFPEFCGNKKALKATSARFTVRARTAKQQREATVTVASPGKATAGKHFDVGFFDDLVHEQNYENPKMIEKVIKAFRLFIPLIDPAGYRYVTGTRYAHGDLYEEIIKAHLADTAAGAKGTWLISVKDCWADGSQDQTPRFIQRVIKRPSGEEKVIGFTREKLLSIMREDPAMFSAQYLNQPASTSAIHFTEEMMNAAVIHADAAPALSPAVLIVDLAGTTTHLKSDDSVVICGKTDNMGNYYVTDVRGGQFKPEELAYHVINMALIHRPTRILIEKTPSAMFFAQTLRWMCQEKQIVLPIDFIPVTNVKDAKYTRIAGLVPLIKSQRLRFFAGLMRWDKILEQFTQFPKAKYGHDDYPDTIALLIQAFGISLVPKVERHPFLRMLELQAARNAALFLQANSDRPRDNDLGDGFAC